MGSLRRPPLLPRAGAAHAASVARFPRSTIHVTPVPLVVEVAARLSVVPSLAEQLTDTARQVEGAVVEVCGRFDGIADKARRGVQAANDLVHSSDGHDSFTALLARVQHTMHAMDGRLTATADRSMEAITRLEHLTQSLRDVCKTLDRIEDLATGLRVLAINAKIEAVRSGERGAGFAVVADEMQRAGKDSRQLAEHIRDGVAIMTSETSALATLLRDGARADLESVEACRHEIAGTSAALAANNDALVRSVHEGAALGDALAQEISAAVVGLQFQDRVSQRISHVVDALTQMRASLTATLPAHDDGHVAARGAALHDQLNHTYTMWEERKDAAPSTGDVELF